MKKIILFLIIAAVPGIFANAQKIEEIVITKTGEVIFPEPFQEFKESSDLILSKKFTGETIESTKNFDIETNASTMDINLSGSTKSGKINIRMVMPDGKDLKSIEIDPTSDVRWMKKINLKDNSKNYSGKWKIIITTEKADGSYRVYIHTK